MKPVLNAVIILFQFLVFLAILLMETLVRLLPLRLCEQIGSAVGAVGSWFSPSYRKLVRRNLRIAFEGEKTEAEINSLAKDHFVSLGRNFLVSLKTALLPLDEIEKRVSYEGFEHMQAAAAAEKGIIIAISHSANWELFARLPAVTGGLSPATLFQKVKNPFLNQHIEKRRAASGLKLFDRSTGFSGPTEHLRANGAVGVLFDQHAGDRGVWCPFFGRLASTTNLPALLSLRTSAPVISVGLFRNGPGSWKVVCRPAHFPPAKVGGRDARQNAINELTAKLNAELEEFVRADPREWFWVHNRWKTPEERFLLAPYKRGVFVPQTDVPVKIKPFRLLVRSPNPLGDACMAIPAIRAIKRSRIDVKITILCRENLKPLWERLPEIDDVIAVPKKLGKRKIGKIVRENADYDAALLLPNSLSSAIEAKSAGIKHIAGYEGHSRKRLLDHIARPAKVGSPVHHVNFYLHLAEQIGADISDTDSLLLFGGGKTVPTPGEIRIGVCPGAEYGNAKRYPLDRYTTALNTVREAAAPGGAEMKFLIFGSPNEKPIGEELAGMLGDANFNRAGKTTIDGLIEELLTCDVLVSNDTGTMHLGAVMGIPTVAIFGSTEPQLTAPLGPGHTVLRHYVECSPCFLRDCAFDYRCMLRLEPNLVSDAIISQLKKLSMIQ